MSKQLPYATCGLRVAQQRSLALLIGLGMSLPAAAAIPIPDVPLQTGTAVPPNILYLLDNSGSMEGTRFDDGNLTVVRGTMNSVVDTISNTDLTNFNRSTYTSNSLYYDPNVTYRPWRRADGTYPADSAFTSAFDHLFLASGSVNLRTTDQVFHVPIVATSLTRVNHYYRYRFVANSDTVQRCSRTHLASGGWDWRECINVTAVALPGGTSSGRSLAQERTNFANWYSYHRTRAKAAKAGSGQVFASLGEDIRVGYSTIHITDTELPIPVGTDNGLFRGSNRTDFFNSLYGQTKVSGTPLRKSLENAGKYFQRTGADGPWGPEATTAQLSCRQNFTILTTDGYWNGDGSAAANADGTAGATITGPNGASYAYSPAAPYSDTHSDTLADVAMQMWKTDLRTDMTNNVPTTAANPAFWQHMVTFGISIGLRGTLNPASDLPAITAGTLSWPDPIANAGAQRIDDLWHATVNGRGKFIAATEPDAFTEGLRDALAAIVARTASGSNVATNSTAVGSDSRVFQASFVSGQWSGDLKAWPIAAAGIGATPSWSAASAMPAPAARKLMTWTGTTGVAFPTTAQNTTLTAPVVSYLRGVRSGEAQNGGTLRDRAHVLGGIIHSSPAYVKDTDTVYVGANDGMLHAFNAATGVEQFAYIPAGINFTHLRQYAQPAYSHRYFVDGPVVVSTRAQTPATNLLVGALGRGGKGLFALDVSSPGSFASGDVLWDHTGTAAPANMGLVLGRPIIGRMNNGTTAVVVGNGPNSDNHRAVLYVYNLATGAVIAEIDTGVGTAANPNGLSAPRGWDSDGDGTIDLVYAGDLHGNLWRFDLSSNATAQWGNASNRVVMFAAGNGRPITSSPTVALNPQTYETWVFFGTGRYLTGSDQADTTTQTLFGIRDSSAAVAVADLQERRIIIAGTSGGKLVRGFEAAGPLTAGKVGWFINLLTPPNPPGTAEGERIVSDPAVIGTWLLTASIIPSADPCSQGGRGYINALNAFTGASSSTSFFDINNDGVFDDNIGTAPNVPIGSFDPGVAMPGAPGIIGDHLVVGGSDGTASSIKVDMSDVNGRISWREVVRD
jgi:type IV pilus assembly protein PilY1